MRVQGSRDVIGQLEEDGNLRRKGVILLDSVVRCTPQVTQQFTSEAYVLTFLPPATK